MKKELIHGDLSYKIIGIMYNIYNTIGPGFQEKYYQRAVSQMLTKEKIPSLEQVKADFYLDGQKIGKYYLDFVVDNRIVVELKSKNLFSRRDIKQVLGYLKKTGIEVGLLVGFSTEHLKIKRIIRGY